MFLEPVGSDDYVRGMKIQSFLSGMKKKLMFMVLSNDDNNGMPVRYGDTIDGQGFGIYLNDSDQWSLWKHNSDINSFIKDNSKWNLHCLVYDQTHLKYYYNHQKIIDHPLTTINTSSTDNLIIGWSHAAHYFSGQIDEIRVLGTTIS